MLHPTHELEPPTDPARFSLGIADIRADRSIWKFGLKPDLAPPPPSTLVAGGAAAAFADGGAVGTGGVGAVDIDLTGAVRVSAVRN